MVEGSRIIVLSFITAWFVPNDLVSQIKEGRDVVWTRSNCTSKAVKLHLSVPLHFSLRYPVKAVTCLAEELSRDFWCIYIRRWSEKVSTSTIDGNNIGKIFFWVGTSVISIHVKLHVIISSRMFYIAVWSRNVCIT